MLTLKLRDLQPTSKNKADFDRQHKTKVNRSPHQKQVHFGPHSVNLDPPHNNQATFDTDTRTKPNLLQHTNKKVNFDPTTESKPNRSLLQNRFKLRCRHPNHVLSVRHIFRPVQTGTCCCYSAAFFFFLLIITFTFQLNS